MIPLSAYGKAHRVGSPVVGKILTGADVGEWPSRVLKAKTWAEVERRNDKFNAILCQEPVSSEALRRIDLPLIHSVNLEYVQEGDVVSVDQRGHVRTLYRRASRYNALFATDRCNSRCLMCSQPPRAVNDDWRVQEMLEVIRLIDPSTPELGITGGEPTLLKDGFLEVVTECKERLPNTALHILSNGRLFRYGRLAKQLAVIEHPDIMIGIPVYSDMPDRHDHIVQSRGAFDDTLIGLQNLGRCGVPAEIRVVVHSQTYERLPQLAEFIYRNLTFASHVTFMGLELMGFAISNLDLLWIDPWDYRYQLEAATLFLAERGMNVSIYNHQLCTVPESVWPYCRKSISDWKNEYVSACAACGVREQCGGFFTSVVQRRMSTRIEPIVRSELAAPPVVVPSVP
jgi:His-Xaa-Ser system radical SAM maturase HxsC